MDQANQITVLFIIKPERGAGAEMVLVEAAARLNPDRFQVICGLLTPDAEKVIPGRLPTVDFLMPGLNGWVWLRFFFQLCWVIYRRRVDLLHVNSYVPGNYARLAAALMQAPIVIDHWHGFTRFNAKRRFICRFLGRFTDLSLAVSRGVRDYLVTQGGLNPAKVRVVANGVDVAAIDAARPGPLMRRELGLPEGSTVIGLVGRLDHWGKGHQELFTAMAQIRERHPVHALIVGGGRRMDEVRRLAESLGLAGQVHFLGPRRDVPDLLNAMDIFVLPSYSEGVSLALLEAMAAGLPVIATEVGGLPEVVTDGENGLLIPPRDAGALAEALTRLLGASDFAKKLGQNARKHVREHYSLDRLGREINEIYGELVKQKFGGGV
ncbi:MAG: glycosyltransferase [Deltaproteobacteria bacterium]|nr:glycosyltransferase [Deltaproteobacteria bacterium]